MKITVCGSLLFIKEMIEIKEKLEKIGHKVLLPRSVETGQDKNFWNDLRDKNLKKFAVERGERMKGHFEKIKSSDAIVVLNYTKGDRKNYIGGNTFIEMAVAFEHGKKIFVLNPLSDNSEYLDEIHAMQPIFIDGNLSKLSD